MHVKFSEQCVAHVSTVELLAIIWPWWEYTWEEAAMTWGPQGGEICGRHGQLSGKHKRFVFKKATLSTSDGSVSWDRGKTVTHKKDFHRHIWKVHLSWHLELNSWEGLHKALTKSENYAERRDFTKMRKERSSWKGPCRPSSGLPC